jgi:hypothetical protein
MTYSVSNKTMKSIVEGLKPPRKGDWTQTYSGVKFWPLDCRVEEINLIDIAHGLANTCRYNGHCLRFYSVAEHSVLVSRLVKPENALQALFHDAPEAYVGDVIRPLKRFLIGFQEIEDAIFEKVALKFGFPAEMSEDVKRVDSAILGDEQNALFADYLEWRLDYPPLGVADSIACLRPKLARQSFLQRYYELTGKKS